jgi:hypothetical protein
MKIGDCVLCRSKKDIVYLMEYTEKKLGVDWKKFLIEYDYNYPIVIYLYECRVVSWSTLYYFYERQVHNYGGGGFTNLVDINLILRKEKLKKLNEKF